MQNTCVTNLITKDNALRGISSFSSFVWFSSFVGHHFPFPLMIVKNNSSEKLGYDPLVLLSSSYCKTKEMSVKPLLFSSYGGKLTN